MELLEHLRKRQADGRPIRVGLVGCGQEGSGMVHVTQQMAGMETFAIADLDLNRPLKTLRALGIADSARSASPTRWARRRTPCVVATMW